MYRHTQNALQRIWAIGISPVTRTFVTSSCHSGAHSKSASLPTPTLVPVTSAAIPTPTTSGFGPKKVTPSRVPVSKRAQQTTTPTNATSSPSTSSRWSAAPIASGDEVDSSFLSAQRKAFNKTSNVTQTIKATTNTTSNNPASVASTQNPSIPANLKSKSPQTHPPTSVASKKKPALPSVDVFMSLSDVQEELLQAKNATSKPATATATGAVATATGAVAKKLSPIELQEKFPFAKNLSSHQPDSIAPENQYASKDWYLPRDKYLADIVLKKVVPQQAYIGVAESLPELQRYLDLTDTVGIDTEFTSTGTYRPALEVLQISTPHILAAIDVQLLRKTPEFATLLHFLLKKEWIIHSHRGDLEVIHDLCTSLHFKQTVPNAVFDTQIALAFLSPSPSASLATMVKDLEKVELDKSNTLSDWSRRPLTENQIQYALDDVRYLLPIKAKLEKLLKESTAERNALREMANGASSSATTRATTSTSPSSTQSRLTWFREEMSLLLNPVLYAPIAAQAAYTLLRHKFEEGSKELAIFRRLSTWREIQAIKRNQAPYFFLTNDQLIAISSMPPSTVAELASIRQIRKWVVGEFGEEIVKLVNIPPEAMTGVEGGLTTATTGAVQNDPTATVLSLDQDSLSPSSTVAFPHAFPDHMDANRVRWELYSLLSALIEHRGGAMGISSFLLAPRRDRMDLASVSRTAIQKVEKDWSWRGVTAKDRSPSSTSPLTGFSRSLIPSAINYRFSGTSEEVILARIIDAEVQQAIQKEQGKVDAAKGKGKDGKSDASSVDDIQSLRPVTPLPLSTELALLSLSKVLRGWRREWVGQDLLDIIRGDKRLQWIWQDGGLKGSVAVNAVDVSSSTTSAPTSITPAAEIASIPTPVSTEAILAAFDPSSSTTAASVNEPVETKSTKKKRTTLTAEEKAAAAAVAKAEKEAAAAAKRLAAEEKKAAKEAEKLAAKLAKEAAKAEKGASKKK